MPKKLKKKTVKTGKRLEGLSYFLGGFILGLIKPIKKRSY
jgi:hypothetical protein